MTNETSKIYSHLLDSKLKTIKGIKEHIFFIYYNKCCIITGFTIPDNPF